MAITDLMPWKWNEKKLPVRRDEFNDPFYTMQRDMNQFFDNFFGKEFGLSPWSNFGAFSPQIDISETKKEFKVSAELPGLDEDDVELSLSRNMLTISGEKKQEKEDKRENYYHVERAYGSFKRSIALSAEVEADKVEATFKNGVLTVTLPKSAEAQRQAKRITVKNG